MEELEKYVENNKFDDTVCGSFVIKEPKIIAKISICGSLTFNILDNMCFVKPTKDQIKNLHDLLCIDVELLDEE